MLQSEVGPHLLGRVPSPPDDRDYKLSTFMGPAVTLNEELDAILSQLLAARGPAPAVKTFATQLVTLLKQPPPEPPVQSVVWNNPDAVLDQTDTGHCVGFGGAQWGNVDMTNDHFTNEDGHALYYECKVIDGEPNQENGSTVRSIAKVMKNRQRLETYAFTDSKEEIIKFVQNYGSIIVGTDWTEDMFSPDEKGIVHPTGSVEGGHCYLLVGYSNMTKQFWFLNSWGPEWGNNGRFGIPEDEFMELFANGGEACCAVELPVA